MGFSEGVIFHCKLSLLSLLFITYTLNTVCDDVFDSTNAESACHTLGYYGGSFKTINQQDWSLDEIPILMDNVECTSSNDNFLECPYAPHNCDHDENILLTCEMLLGSA